MTRPPQSRTLESGPIAVTRIDKRAEAISYVIAGLLCCTALIWVLQLWRADMHVPLYYAFGTDVPYEGMLVKGMAENGWYLHNPHLGAPGEQSLLDFPITAAAHFLSMKVIGWFTSSWAEVMNVYFLAGFLLATWSALAVQRHFGIGRGPAVVTALLFAFAPYHFYRGENHLRLSAYYVIPLAGLMLLWVMLGETLFVARRRGRFFLLPIPTRKGLMALALCVLLGWSDIYYACLTLLLLAVAGMYRALVERTLRRLGQAIILAVAILLAVTVNLLPNIAHILAEGKNPVVAVRLPAEAEMYALKLTQLVLPVTGHRIPRLAAAKAAYNGTSYPNPVSEGDGSALGICFAAGFCFLLLTLVIGYAGARHGELIRSLGRLNLSAFLLGTVGGVGALLAWTISPQIRAYARVGIFISFFTAVAVAAILDEIRLRWLRPGRYTWIFRVALAGLLAAGILDQTTTSDLPPYEYETTLYRDHAEFVARAEGLLPHGTMVLQLPFVGFPENPAPHNMGLYEHLMPYLHSASFHWSYGTMWGRYWSEWQRDLLARPIEDVVEAAAVAGFGAIYVDTNGYEDGGASIQTSLLGMRLTPIESRDGKLRLYDIGPYATRLRAAQGPGEWSRAKETVLHPLMLRWLSQCSVLEGNAAHSWRWCGGQAGLLVENSSERTAKVDIRASLSAAAGGGCGIQVRGPGWTETFQVSSTAWRPLMHSLEVPPGTSIYRLKSDCSPMPAPDSRPLVFRINDFRATLPDTPPTPELVWKDGCYVLEAGKENTAHGCSSSAELAIRNPGPASQASIRMRLTAASTVSAPLSITGPGFTESVMVDPAGGLFSKRFLVPPGETLLRFSSTATPVAVGNDPHKLVFRVENLRYANPLLEPHVIQAN